MSYNSAVLDRPVLRGPLMAGATIPDLGARRFTLVTLDAPLGEAR